METSTMYKTLLPLLVALTACKGKSECESFDGELAFSSNGDGSAAGTLKWSDSIEEGLMIEIGVQSEDGTSYSGALSKGGLFDFPETCGSEMEFRIDQINAGGFQVLARIQQEGAAGDTGDITYEAEGLSERFDVSGGDVTGLVVNLE
jgi:hypothetical protein